MGKGCWCRSRVVNGTFSAFVFNYNFLQWSRKYIAEKLYFVRQILNFLFYQRKSFGYFIHFTSQRVQYVKDLQMWNFYKTPPPALYFDQYSDGEVIGINVTQSPT